VRIAVVALGKIGLPLAVQFADKGHTVIGADVNGDVVELVNKGIEPFPGEHLLADKLRAVVDGGRLSATTDTAAAVREAEAVVVVVPLFVDAESRPDFAWMDAATAAIAEGLQPGTLVSYETTLPVGTTRERFQPVLESSGLVCGRDFWLVFSPERVLTGRIFADLRRYPKLVGGVDEASTAKGIAFYEAVLDFDERPDLARSNGVWDMGSAEAAELAKLAETTYRDVNIGLANQFALYASRAGIDVHRVIEASNSQPYSHIHRPGIAVGGHCIPVYPRLYLWNDPDATVVRAAREANAGMPERTVALLEPVLGPLPGLRVAVLGAAYRGGVKETAFSGVFGTVDALKGRGAQVLVHDPLYDDDELRALGFTPYHLGDPVDAAVVQADHAAYAEIGAEDLPGVRAVVDGRRITRADGWSAATRIVLGEPLPEPPAPTA
jgi:nucleotide sugar dehydrogenase